MTSQVCIRQQVFSAFPYKGSCKETAPDAADAKRVLYVLILMSFFRRCDFEHDTCGFEHQDADLLWQLVTPGSLSDGSILPSTDHSLRRSTGHFMFADPMSSQDGSYNGKAWFGSPGTNRQVKENIEVLK